MTASVMSEWKALRRGRPGHRFVERHESGRRTQDRRSVIGRVVRMVIAVVALAAGVVLMFIPGPAILFFFIAGSLFAAESRHVARMLDWIEVQLRKLAKWLWTHWCKLSRSGQIFTAALLAVASAGVLWYGYRLWSD